MHLFGCLHSFRLIVTKSTIDNAKKKICVEVNLVNEISVSMNNGKSLSFSKILIMFKNEDGIKKSSSALFYCGKNVYYTPPYLNSKGASLAEEIKRICESAIQK